MYPPPRIILYYVETRLRSVYFECAVFFAPAPCCLLSSGFVIGGSYYKVAPEAETDSADAQGKCEVRLLLKFRVSFAEHRPTSPFSLLPVSIVSATMRFGNPCAQPQRFLKQPFAKLLLAAGAVYLLAFQYCRIRFWRDPHSAFFDIRDVFEWKYSLVREHQANHFISLYNAPSGADNPVLVKNPPVICAALATVKRNKDDYLAATVGSMLSDLDPRERQALHLSVLFANTDPTQHPSWGQRWLDRLSDSVSTYNVSEEELRYLQGLEERHDFHEKGV